MCPACFHRPLCCSPCGTARARVAAACLASFGQTPSDAELTPPAPRHAPPAQVYKQMLNRHKCVYTSAEALEWLCDVASGMEYLHSHSEIKPMIIHRDLKVRPAVCAGLGGGVAVQHRLRHAWRSAERGEDGARKWKQDLAGGAAAVCGAREVGTRLRNVPVCAS